MTIICCSRTEMAADSQISDGDLARKCEKIHKINGEIIGFAGEAQDGLAFIDWFRKGKPDDKPELSDDFSGVMLTKSGQILEYESKLYPRKVLEKTYAIGNGSHVAIGAMEMGASPEQAVKIACKWIDGCKLPVKVVKRE